MTQPNPAAIAAADQDHARVKELVEHVRCHHAASSCEHTTVCLGRYVADTLYDMCPDRMAGLLAAALLQLASTNHTTTNQKG